MSRFVSMNNNTTRHTANTGAACSACASFASVMIILAGIAVAMSFSFILPLLVLGLCIIIGLVIIMRLDGAQKNRPKAMSMS